MSRLRVMRIVAARTQEPGRFMVRCRPIDVIRLPRRMAIETFATRREADILLEQHVLDVNTA
jgi:hypothetical protein